MKQQQPRAGKQVGSQFVQGDDGEEEESKQPKLLKIDTFAANGAHAAQEEEETKRLEEQFSRLEFRPYDENVVQQQMNNQHSQGKIYGQGPFSPKLMPI